MAKKLTPDERIARAQASIEQAKNEIQKLPPSGRERTYIILRARKHLLAAKRVLNPLLRKRKPRPERQQEAALLVEQIENIWPSGQTGR